MSDVSRPYSGMHEYKPAIDGLRAVSVTSVVLYHAGCPLTPGGFVGVDVFFVISGYLITQLLLNELANTGNINLLEFWARRARRLLPSAFIVVLAAAGFAVFMLPPYDMHTAGRDLIAASTYVLNWRLALRSVDYLAEGERHSLFLHFWSLSVEEQFYLVWPVALALLALSMRRGAWTRTLPSLPVLTGLILIVGVISFLSNIYQTAHNQPFAFFGTNNRAWQLLTGALLAALPSFRAREAIRLGLTWLGMALIAGAVVVYGQTTAYPGIAALVPVAGAAMVVLSNHRAGSSETHSWLSHRGVVYVGKISYVWYLWHWPALVLGALAVDAARWEWRATLVAVSFALAALTHVVVERPCRFSPLLAAAPRRCLAMGLIIGLVSIGIGFAMPLAGGDARIQVPGGGIIDARTIREDIPIIYRDACHLDRSTTVHQPCQYGDVKGDPTIVLLGDSHAAQWFPAIDIAAQRRSWRLLSRTKTRCPAADVRIWAKHLKRENLECEQWRNGLVEEIKNIRPSLIIVGSASDYEPIADATGRILSGELRLSALREGEARFLSTILNASKARVLVMHDTPWLPEDPVECLFRKQRSLEQCVWPTHAVLRTTASPFTLTGGGRASMLDLSGRVCPNDVCSAARDGVVVMRDRHHLTASYAAGFADIFERYLAAADNRRP